MSGANQPRGTSNLLDPRLRFARVPLLATLAFGLVFAIVYLDNSTRHDYDQQWKRLDSGLTHFDPGLTERVNDAEASSNTPVATATPPWFEQEVSRGDTLSIIFKRAGYDERDVHTIVNEAENGRSLAKIFPGETIAFQSDSSGTLTGVKHIVSPLEAVTYRLTDSGFERQVETRSPDARQAWISGVIRSSLFNAGQEAGVSQGMIMNMATIFGGVVDFALDPRRGDTMQLLYEELFLDGKKIRDGDIIAASFTNQGETFNAFRYTDTRGETNYYNEEGFSMRKAFLMAPLDFTRISSNFNLRRLHPIYKTTRPHRGTDYAAPTGTPVYASGDGRVVKSGYTKANGNYVFIRHGDRYVTRYLHLHKRAVSAGRRVTQGQIIGTVGATGTATGPHLHYEFLVNGVHRNPRSVVKQLPKAKQLPRDEMENFQLTVNRASKQLIKLRSGNSVAMSAPADANLSAN
ncbi:peptidoglycan DD-metalloendopeptidase family protein [Candidatus Marimicrobium litorale]|uniref:Peptidase M23 n=1 Tax=Candidatus Marimicrobium litorale TaxID=2518991 RepID=A0ABT3TA51_9GAMM|nr:peptidoglycan DD-metalloendopeptidase family protein [Candidatus Marimicrobium litorale]MCX2979158.1 peptidase M23 [Candidatus Marimicrobium litorale]